MNSFDFSENFKLLRRTSDVTQAELSDALGIHPQTVSKWERGVSLPDISKLGELAVVLKTSLEKLLALPESAEPVEIAPFDAVRLGDAIAEKRRALGENQQQLATTVNVSSDAVSRWERGVSCPGIEEFRALVQHFGCDASQLYYAVANEETLSFAVVAKKKRFFWPFVCALALLVVAVVSLAVVASMTFATHTVLVDGKSHEVARADWFAPVAETKEGYDFLYWQNADGEKVDFPAKITRNCEIFAVYAPTEYAVDYWLNGGEFEETPNFTITVESGYLHLPKARKNGTEFVGWYLSPDYSGKPVTEISCNLQNVTLYAAWQDATYTVKYFLDGGVLTENNPETVLATESVTLYAPTKKGCVFVGWFDAPQGGNKVESVGGTNAKNMILYAVWQRAEEYFTVTYNLDGGEVLGSNPQKIAKGEWYQLAAATKRGYDFVCWNDSPDGNGNVYLNLQDVTKNVTLFAIFKPHVYVVVYEYSGAYATPEDVNPNSVTFGDVVELNPVVRYGYEFVGWFDDAIGGNKITALNSQNIVDVSVLYARFTPIICKVTCNADGGLFACDDGEENLFDFSVPYGSSFTLPQARKDGYVFVGWHDGTDYVTTVNVLKITNFYLTAHWRKDANYYTVTYHLNGGELGENSPQKVNVGEVVALPTPTLDGFEFLGWYDCNSANGNKYVYTPQNRANDLELWALWQEIRVEGSKDDFTYDKGLTSVAITGYTGSLGTDVDVVVPSQIDGLPVTQITSLAGNVGVDGVTLLGSVVLPDGLECIADNAFHNVTVCKTLTIPHTVTEIGQRAFSLFNGRLQFAENSLLENIGEYAFEYAKINGVLQLPQGVTTISKGAFANACIFELTLGNNVTIIQENAFIGSQLSQLYVPQSVKFIHENARINGAPYFVVSTQNTYLQNVSEQNNSRYATTCTVTLRDGDSVQTITDERIVLPTPTRDGLRFVGWQNSNGEYAQQVFLPQSDAELVAVWESADGTTPLKAIFIPQDGSVTVTVTRGEPLYFVTAQSGKFVLNVTTGSERINQLISLNRVKFFLAFANTLITNGDEFEINSGTVLTVLAPSDDAPYQVTISLIKI